MDTPRFSDFAEISIYDGKKVPIDSVLGHELKIIQFTVEQSKFNSGNYIKLQFYDLTDENKLKIIFTSSKVLSGILRKYQDNLPFVAILIRAANGSLLLR